MVSSRVDFNATLETSYLIQVDGSAKATGSPTNAVGYVNFELGSQPGGGDLFVFLDSLSRWQS